jgi:hypothetical protein
VIDAAVEFLAIGLACKLVFGGFGVVGNEWEIVLNDFDFVALIGPRAAASAPPLIITI